MAFKRSRSGSPQRTSLGVGSVTALGPPWRASRESEVAVLSLSSRAARLPARTRLDEAARNSRRDVSLLAFIVQLLIVHCREAISRRALSSCRAFNCSALRADSLSLIRADSK